MLKKSLLFAIVVATISEVEGHGFLTSPLPRQYREEGLEGIGWTKWMGITVPGDGSFNPGDGNAPNLNAGIGGGVGGLAQETTVGHGLCGDLGWRKGFESGLYGATPPRLTVQAGGTLPVSVKLTAYHAGWFEFRLCNPGSGVITQECLNEHVLEIDESTPYYPKILDYAHMKGLTYGNDPNQDGGWYKCQTSGGHFDPTSNTPNTVWPSGSCCSGGGSCSDPLDNKDRYIAEFAGGGGVRNYDITLKVPEGMNCDNCILQWFYQTANSREAYPESFWNCADIAVRDDGLVTSKPPTSPTYTPPTPTSAPPTTTPPTPTSTVTDCVDIQEGCQATWCGNEYWNSQCQHTCNSCSGSSGTMAPTTQPVPVATQAPTQVTVGPMSTSAPTTSVTTGGNNSGCNQCSGCWWTATTPEIGCYSTWSASLCASYASAGYQWCGN